MSVFNIYLLGFLIFVVGLAIAAHLLGVPPLWIAAGVITLLGIGVMTAVGRARRDPSKKI